MDVTNSDDHKYNFAALNENALFSDDELALLNNSVYSLEPFDSGEFDGILNYNYASAHDPNTTDFPPSWNGTEVENSSNDFLNDGIDYGNLLSSCIDNSSGPINPANDLLSLDLLQEQPYELILPYEPEQDHQPKTDANDIVEFDWDEFVVHSPKVTETTANETTCEADTSILMDMAPTELSELQQSLITKFEALKYHEIHQCDFSIDDKDEAEAEAEATSATLPMENLRRYHVFVMPLDRQANYEASMQSVREKLHKSPQLISSLVGQSLDTDKQSKLIIPFKPKLVDFRDEEKTCDDPSVIPGEADSPIKTKKSRKQPIILTEALKTRNEIHDVLEAIQNVAENPKIKVENIDGIDNATNARPSNERKGPKEKVTSKSKKSQEQKVTNFRCSERIQQRRRRTRVTASTKRHDSDSAKSNHRSAEPSC